MAPNPSIYDSNDHHAAYLRANDDAWKSVIDEFITTCDNIINYLDRRYPTADHDDDGYHPAYRAAYLRARNNHPANHRNPARHL